MLEVPTWIKTIFRCNCPHQNTLLCPHHIYVRETLKQIESEGKYSVGNGFQLRLASALQAHKDWTPLQQDGDESVSDTSPKWEHCSVYKARHHQTATPTPDNVKSGKELACANWIQNQESFSKLVRGLCAECLDGHGVRKPLPVKGRFIEDTEVDVDVAVTENENGIRPSTPNINKAPGSSQQTPLRKILSQAKQKVIRHSLGGASENGDGSGSRASTPVPTAGGTRTADQTTCSVSNPESPGKEKGKGKGKGKELPDVFARLLLGTGPTKRQGSGNSGTGTPVSVKRPVSRQAKGAGRGGK